MAIPLMLLVARVQLWGKVSVALLAVYSLAVTAGLAAAGHAREVTRAVDPFGMSFPPFQSLAGLFPLYTWWTTETWSLTFFWLTLACLATGATIWTELPSSLGRFGPARLALLGINPFYRGGITS